jgi:hypothetical protein
VAEVRRLLATALAAALLGFGAAEGGYYGTAVLVGPLTPTARRFCSRPCRDKFNTRKRRQAQHGPGSDASALTPAHVTYVDWS